MTYETILYDTDGAIATITLNRPERLNTIVPPMPDEIEAAVNQAVRDEAVRVIVLRGAGRAFCAGPGALSAPGSTSARASTTGTRASGPAANGTPARTS